MKAAASPYKRHNILYYLNCIHFVFLEECNKFAIVCINQPRKTNTLMGENYGIKY